ncbi:MAG: IPT/TIG domain-containing protein [Deltaproteobacteria bacterium]|nr:IPT/TIG domain-containing protein [Deltaproteobacteria bacterium]
MSATRIVSVVLLSLSLFSMGAGCKNKALTFESINPPSGRLGGGEELRIRGTGFGQLGNLQDVRIGGRAATNVGVQGDDTIVLTTPEGLESQANTPLDVTLLSSDGKSILLRSAFTFVPGGAGAGATGPNADLRRRL